MNRTASIINTTNVIMSKPTAISSSSSISDIDKLMASTATLATESSSISSIDTTFLGAAAHMCNRAAGIPQGEKAAPDENDENDAGADDAADASAGTPAEPVVAAMQPCTAMHENNTAYLRPRKRELHHLTVAVDILNELDNEESDNENTDDSISRPFDNVERGLTELLRPQKKERHFFSIAEDILQDLEGDE